jgi:hypothetical protein
MTGDRALYDDGVLRITTTDDPPGLAIAGEIDESTYEGLISALEKLTDGPAEIHVSLAAVSYCDLAGLRAIVRITGAESNGADGSGTVRGGNGGRRRVVLHGVSRPIKTVLQIVGWDSIPGLALDQPDSIPPASAGESGSHGHRSVIW